MDESHLAVMKPSTAVVYFFVTQAMQKARKVFSEGTAGPLRKELVDQSFANKLQRIFAKPVRVIPIGSRNDCPDAIPVEKSSGPPCRRRDVDEREIQGCL